MYSYMKIFILGNGKGIFIADSAGIHVDHQRFEGHSTAMTGPCRACTANLPTTLTKNLNLDRIQKNTSISQQRGTVVGQNNEEDNSQK